MFQILKNIPIKNLVIYENLRKASLLIETPLDRLLTAERLLQYGSLTVKT